jgi:hypothetical protein
MAQQITTTVVRQTVVSLKSSPVLFLKTRQRPGRGFQKKVHLRGALRSRYRYNDRQHAA